MEKDIALVAVGFVVGAMNAIAGGGMLVGFPVLVALGITPITANATGTLITAPGQLASAIGYWQYLRKVPIRFAWLLVPAVIGAAFGSLTLRNTSPHDFARLVPMLVLFGVALFTFQPFLHFHLHRHLKRRTKQVLPLFLLALAMIPLCFYGGYFGAGYGFLMLAFLGFTKLPDTHMINAMKNVSAIFVSTTSMLCLYGAHLIDWRIGGITAVGTISGGFLGARGAQKVSSQWLRLCIIIIGIAAVIYLAFQEY